MCAKHFATAPVGRAMDLDQFRAVSVAALQVKPGFLLTFRHPCLWLRMPARSVTYVRRQSAKALEVLCIGCMEDTATAGSAVPGRGCSLVPEQVLHLLHVSFGRARWTSFGCAISGWLRRKHSSLHRCSTLTEGRNRLLEVALERYAANDAAGPLYYIYLDGDVRLEEVKDFGTQCERLTIRTRAHRRCFDLQAETPAMRGVHLKRTSRSGNLQ